MTTAELKRYIFNNDKIIFVLEMLGCSHIREWPERISACNPDGDNTNAVQVYRNEFLNVTNYTRDLSCIGNYSDIFTLIQLYRHVDFRDAVKWLHDILGLKLTYSTQKVEDDYEDPSLIFKSLRRRSKSDVEWQILNDEILLDYAPYPHIDFVKSATVSQSTINKFQLGYSYNVQRTVLPVRLWSSGDLIGVRGRTAIPSADILGIPKYFPLKPFATSSTLYGLWENYDAIVHSGSVIVFEGEKSVLTADSLQPFIISLNHGTPLYGVSIFGHELSDEQSAILAGLNLKEVIIAFDKDMDEQISWKACEKLYHIRNVSYIFDTYNLLQEHDAPIDQGIRKLMYLYNHRIAYTQDHHVKYLSKNTTLTWKEDANEIIT